MYRPLNKKRWKLTDYPDSITFKEVGEKVHPEIFYFTELRPQDRELLTGFADHAKKINQAATLHLFGSRIDGRWREDSDYDIMIKGVDSKEEQEKIRAYKSDARLDLRFITGEIKAHTVEIK